jgi:hypothetical protein
MEFLDLSPELPDPIDFCSTLAQLHQMNHSPPGKFGFSSITCHGPNWQQKEWYENWCYYFTRLLNQFFSRWMNLFGPDLQFERAIQDLQGHAIPQFLEPLQAEGCVLRPCPKWDLHVSHPRLPPTVRAKSRTTTIARPR